MTTKTSRHTQKELLISNYRREKLERQHEAALHHAKRKQQIELHKLQREQPRIQLEKEHLHREGFRSLQEHRSSSFSLSSIIFKKSNYWKVLY